MLQRSNNLFLVVLSQGGRVAVRIGALLMVALAMTFSQAQTIARLAVSPASVSGGDTSTGKITLSKKAGLGGVTVSLESSSAAATVPATVNVLKGATTASFSISTSPVLTSTTVKITGTLGSSAAAVKLTILGAKLKSLTFSPSSVVCGNEATGVASLDSPAPTGGFVVQLASASSALQVPASVNVAAGSSSVSFTASTTGVSATTAARVKASAGGTSVSGSLKITVAELTTLSLNPSNVTEGGSSTGTVGLNGLAPTAGAVVRLSCPLLGVKLPMSVSIPSGARKATFSIETTAFEEPESTTVTAKYDAVSLKASLTISLPALSAVTVTPTSLIGGNSASGTVTLSGAALSNGFMVTLSSNQPSVKVPQSLTVPSGASSATFSVSTTPVSSATQAMISASAGKSSIGVPLTVNPPRLSSLKGSPTSVTGGTNSTGSVTLNGPAPSGGFKISLKSSQPVAVVPASVSVSAGSTTATFTITTSTITSTATASISATDPFNTTVTTTLIVGPTDLAGSSWAKFRGNLTNTGLGIGTGADGTTQWVTQTNNQTSWSSPAIGPGGMVFVGSDDGNLYAISPAGDVKWKYQTGARVMGSPAVDSNGVIYVGSDDSNFYAINANGTLKWKYQGGQTFESSPTIASDGTIYCGCFDGNLYAFNPDGTKKWALYTGSGGIFGSPAIGSDGTIYVGVENGGLYAVDPSGRTKWVFSNDAGFYQTPSLGSDGTIYVTSDFGNLYAVNPDGSQKWVSTVISAVYGDQVSSPGIGPDGTIYVGSFDGNVVAVNPDGTTRWKYLTGSYVQSSPAIGPDGVVYISSNDGKIYAFHSDGTVKWTSPYGGLSMSPALAPDGTVYVSAPGSGLCAISKAGA